MISLPSRHGNAQVFSPVDSVGSPGRKAQNSILTAALIFCSLFALMFSGARLMTGQPSPSSWSERGPAVGGRLSAIVATDPAGNTLLAASPGGGVWRTLNAGSTWTFPAQNGLGDNTAVHLEWDAAARGRLFLLTWNGLYATTDNGDSWTNLVNPGGIPAPLQVYQPALADAKPFAQMVFSPTQRAVLAAIPCSGLFYSFDGATFTQTWPFPGGSANLDNCIGTIAADPHSGRVYFSTLAQSPLGAAHVFRSNCVSPPVAWRPGTPCLKWESANGGLPSNAILSAMTSVATASTPDHLVALTTGTASNTSTYLTTNGLSWTLQSTMPSPSWTPRSLVYTGQGQEMFQGNVLASYTNNFGANWTNFTLPNEHPDVRAIYPLPGRVWTVTDGSMDGSYANVTRWAWKSGMPPVPGSGVNLGFSGLTVLQAYFAAVVPVTGQPASRRVFVGAQDNGSFCSDSLGLSGWTASGSPPGGGSGDIFGFASAPSDPNRAYSWSGETVSFEMAKNAANSSGCAAVAWSTVTPAQSPANAQMSPPAFWSRHAIAVHPANQDRLYFAFLLDMGETQNASASTPLVVHHALPDAVNPTVIYVDASGTIYVGTVGHGAYKSTNNGATWSAWGPGTTPAPDLVTAITSSGGPNPTFWMATTSGLYKGTAGGPSWTLTTGGRGYTVSDVAVDPHCPTRVYAAFGFAGIRGEHRGGIDFSWNNGASWTSITTGQILHQGPITMVQVDPSNSASVYAATYGRGFWVYAWGSQLRPCAP